MCYIKRLSKVKHRENKINRTKNEIYLKTFDNTNGKSF